MDRVVVITGAGRGIGAATARFLAGQGYNVCVNYKSNAESACRLASEIETMGMAAVAVQADISIEGDVVRLFNEVDRSLGTLTRGLSLEIAEMGIRVNGVRPGYINTEMHTDGGEPGRVERLKSRIPLKRGGEAYEVAAAIAWLLSDEASYVTGSFIDLGGGN